MDETENWSVVVYKSKRKTVALQVVSADKILVKAPNVMSDQDLKKVLERHKRWINDRLQEFVRAKDRQPTSKMLYKGEWLDVCFDGTHKQVVIEETRLILPKEAKNNIVQYFLESIKEKFRIEVEAKVSVWASQIGHTPKKIRLNKAKTRWGSCSSRRNININLRLVMAPESVLDYVIVHELCHLKHPNHSKYFWQMVSKFCPQYKESKQWLKENGHFTNLI
jgi:predicted metal-dependent hydrolase